MPPIEKVRKFKLHRGRTAQPTVHVVTLCPCCSGKGEHGRLCHQQHRHHTYEYLNASYQVQRCRCKPCTKDRS